MQSEKNNITAGGSKMKENMDKLEIYLYTFFRAQSITI